MEYVAYPQHHLAHKGSKLEVQIVFDLGMNPTSDPSHIQRMNLFTEFAVNFSETRRY